MSPNFYLELFKNLPPQISTLLIATLPVGELRASIPIALNYYDLSVSATYFWSVIGNMIPAVFIVYFIGATSDYLSAKSKVCHGFFDWLFKRTRKKFNGHYEKYGMLALTLFVAIPLPVTGAWTGSIASWLFGLPRKKSILYIFTGVLIAGIIVTLLTLGVIKINGY